MRSQVESEKSGKREKWKARKVESEKSGKATASGGLCSVITA
ncbi:MAG: hypothetical protein WCV67_07020 [Victivallaceae bacterium]